MYKKFILFFLTISITPAFGMENRPNRTEYISINEDPRRQTFTIDKAFLQNLNETSEKFQNIVLDNPIIFTVDLKDLPKSKIVIKSNDQFTIFFKRLSVVRNTYRELKALELPNKIRGHEGVIVSCYLFHEFLACMFVAAATVCFIFFVFSSPFSNSTVQAIRYTSGGISLGSFLTFVAGIICSKTCSCKIERNVEQLKEKIKTIIQELSDKQSKEASCYDV